MYNNSTRASAFVNLIAFSNAIRAEALVKSTDIVAIDTSVASHRKKSILLLAA